MASIERECELALINAVSAASVTSYTSEREGGRLLPNLTAKATLTNELLGPFTGVFGLSATLTYTSRADSVSRAGFDHEFETIVQQLYQSPNLASYMTSNSNLTVYKASINSETGSIVSTNRSWKREILINIQASTKKSSLLSGILAYWKLDNTTWIDSSGNGNTLSYFNTNPDSVSGKINNSASFSGSNYLYKNNFQITTSCSFSFWFKSSTSSGVDLGVGVGGDNYMGGFRILSIDGVIYFQCPNTDVVTSSSSFCDGTFHHAVGVSDGSSIKLYIDGNLMEELNSDIGEIDQNTMLIGSYSDGIAKSGTIIDEVGVWSRNLSEVEIASIYNSNSGKTYPF